MAGTYSLTLGAEPEPNLEEPLQEDSRDLGRGVRIESPRHGRVRFSPVLRATLWTIGLITVAMMAIVALVNFKMSGLASLLTTKRRGQAPVESEAVIDLYELNINTSHGMVPKKLQVSGVDCGPAGSGYAELLNGNYTYEDALDGRPRYKSQTAHKLPGTSWWKSWVTTSHHTYLYYSSSNVSSGPCGEWHFNYSSHSDGMTLSELKVTRNPPLLSSPEVRGPAKALPPRRITWKVMCDESTVSPSYMNLPLTLHATGKMETTQTCAWRYVNMVLKGGSMSTKQGTGASITDGGSSSQEYSVGLTPEANYELRDKFGAKLGGNFGYRKIWGSSWEVGHSKSNEVGQSHKWSRDGALFQWTCDVKEATLGTHLTTERTAEYAITDYQGQLPKCCPGWSADGAAYQKCNAGPELPKCEKDSAARARIAAAERTTTLLSVSSRPEAGKGGEQSAKSKLMTTTAASSTTTTLLPSWPSPMVMNAGKVSPQHVAAETAADTAAALVPKLLAMQRSQTPTQLPRPLKGSGEHGHTVSGRHLKFKGLCVGVKPGNVHRAGSMVMLRPCHEGHNIQWVEDENKLKLMADMTKCIDVQYHKFWNHSPLQISDCLEDSDDQIVTRQPDGRYQWRNTEHGVFYIDVRDGDDTRKSLYWRALQIWTKGPNQVFSA